MPDISVGVGDALVEMPVRHLGFEHLRGSEEPQPVYVFGDTDVVGDAGLLACEPNYVELYETLRSLKQTPDGEELTRGNDGGLVVRLGDYAIKYCWENVSALDEGIASEIIRLGLEQTTDHNGPRLTVPRVVGGITTVDGGVLITEFARGFTPANRLDVASGRACDDDSYRRKQLYRLAIAMSTADMPKPNDRLYMFDDGAHNVMWPTDFRTTDHQPLPDDMVCIDFAKVCRSLPAMAAALA